MRIIFFLMLLSVSSWVGAVDGVVKEITLGSGIVLRYEGEVGGRYKTISIVRNDKVLRRLRGRADGDGVFEFDAHPAYSPDGRYVLINQVESGVVTASDGARYIHEVAYCELVDVTNGCIVARDTGQFCAGEFNKVGGWETSIYPNINLDETTPAAKKYVSGHLMPADSPEASFENLLVCDPVGINNAVDYQVVIYRNIFGLSKLRRDEFNVLLKDLLSSESSK